MGDTEQGDERLTDEAIDLAIRLQSDPDNPVTEEVIRTWRARGPEHERVWRRVAGLYGATGQLLGERRKAERRKAAGLTRRNVVLGGGAAIGAAAAGSIVLPGAILRANADETTGTAEIRDVDLPDGTTMTMGPDSAIALDFTPLRRHVELLAGMSFFDVAPDAARPFSVHLDDLAVETHAARFEVSSDAATPSVAVEDGGVRVLPAKPDGWTMSAEGSDLRAGQWLSLDPSTRRIARGTREAREIGSWRDAVLIAEAQSVAILIARVGRWIPGRIVMADPSVGSQLVSGVFDLRDPVRALQAVVEPTGAHVRRFSPFLTLISPL